MFRPLFVVIARVVSRDQALPKWRERLQGLCQVSKQEPYSHSYYWGYDLDGEPDTIWGLEGYHHPVGFFMNHVSSDTFKEEMRKVDQDNLLRHEQGLASPDYDLHHYDLFAGFAKRENDKGPDDEDSFVAVVHFWALDGRRKQILGTLADVVDRVKASSQRPLTLLQSFMVLKEVNHFNMVSLYIRTKTQEDWDSFEASDIYQTMKSDSKQMIVRSEVHRSQAFIGHISQEAPAGDL